MVPYDIIARDFSGGKSDVPLLREDRLFPADPATRTLARRLYDEVRGRPRWIVDVAIGATEESLSAPPLRRKAG